MFDLIWKFLYDLEPDTRAPYPTAFGLEQERASSAQTPLSVFKEVLFPILSSLLTTSHYFNSEPLWTLRASLVAVEQLPSF